MRDARDDPDDPDDPDDLDDLLAEQIAYYSARAPEYLDDAGILGVTPETQGEAAQAIEAALRGAAPLGETLELACGPGTFTPLLAEHATTLTAIDASPEMLEIAARRTAAEPNIRFEQADLFAWAPERTYDFVFFAFWLSHVPEERFARFWSGVAAALNESGRVMFVDDGYRTEDELIEGPGSSTIARRLRDGRRFRAVKVPRTPDGLQRELESLGWATEVRPLAGPFFLGQARLRP